MLSFANLFIILVVINCDFPGLIETKTVEIMAANKFHPGAMFLSAVMGTVLILMVRIFANWSVTLGTGDPEEGASAATVSALIVGIAYIMKGPTRWGFPVCLIEAALVQLLYLVLAPFAA
eukprot:TRINITY_DN6829_c0_g1_i1.p1 TRINITY_DN6829_c0_g1~~TRINITY_DN6829_c0_g1_i1.p1  ORF type:complete len:120 (+),score=0.90 TRINITY_DN6829_c0_g1_i1:96-455(+)